MRASALYPRLARRLALLALLPVLAAPVLVAGCDSSGDSEVVAGVDLAELFAGPTAPEKTAILADWAARDVSPREVREIATLTVSGTGLLGTTRTYRATVVEHSVAGVTHVGAVLVPTNVAAGTRLPIAVYAHGGDKGTSVEEGARIAGILTPDGQNFVWVVPSFRAEALRFGSSSRTSGGPASPWDYDVDDALALVNIAAASYGGDATRIGAVGFSRGGDVALLMAIRDRRISRVLNMFGPTDFYAAYVRDITRDALAGGTRNLPGFDVLNARFIQPLKVGTVTVPQMRAELLRRSPAQFPDRLPAVQVQHGTADDVVDVSQARRLIEVMKGRPNFSSFLWDGGRHDPTTFPINWISEAQAFLSGL